MIKELSNTDPILRYPAFYNAYPIKNEFHQKMGPMVENIYSSSLPHIETSYGRIFDPGMIKISSIFGDTDRMGYYHSETSLKVIGEFRVPHRKIPLYECDSLGSINTFVEKYQRINPNYKILLRGQNKIYSIERSDEERKHLYGRDSVVEPSFHPSHLRQDYDEIFMHSMWHNQTSLLINHLALTYKNQLSEERFKLFYKDATGLRNSPIFGPLALGLAQHYGLPSVGLDLTDKVEVAAWFSLHTMNTKVFPAKVFPINESHNPTIFVFRCPEDAVFEYKAIRPEIFPEGRPDFQSAWFGHVGWGVSPNQLGSYLAFAFRLNGKHIEELPKQFHQVLFPDSSKDMILDYFIKQKNRANYEGEAKRALSQIYSLT
jgi:hypothetical protein